MKQTNNAIKFLMAQYRAIFKNAYFKGIASAVLLTAGLAAGQAQAAPLNAGTWPTVSGSVTVSTGGTYDSLSIDASSGVVYVTNTNAATITITSGAAASANKIQAGSSAGSGATVTGANTNIVIESSTDNTVGLTISGSANAAASLTVADMTINKGTLNLTGGAANTGAATLKADTITLGGTAADAKITFADANDAAGWAVLEGRLTNANGGTGTLDFTGFGNLKTYTDANGVNVDITVAGEKGATLDLSAQTEEANKTMKLVGGKFDIQGSGTAGTFTVTNGTLDIGADVNLTNTTSTNTKAGTLVVSGTDVADATVRVDTTVLKNFLTASGDQAGSVKLDKGTLELVGDEKFDLATDVTFGDANTAGAITQGANSGDSVIKGTNLAVSAALTDAKANKVAIVATDTLTLGKSDAASTDLKFGSATARNLTLLSNSDTFTLANDVTLKAIDEVDNPFLTDEGTIKVAGNGQLDVEHTTISGTNAQLTIAAGNYSTGYNVTLNQGKLTVGNQAAGTEFDGVDASLKLTGKLSLVNTNSNTITIAGNSGSQNIPTDDTNNPISRKSSAVLDLTGVTDIDISSGDSMSRIAVNEGGQLLLSSNGLIQLLRLDQSTPLQKSGAGITLSGGGYLFVDGSIQGANNTALSTAKITSGAAATDTISFSGDGLIEARDTIWLADDGSTHLNIANDGELKAQTLRLDGKDDAAFQVVRGNLTAGTRVESSNGNSIQLGNGTSGATLNLGYIEADRDEWGRTTGTYTTSSATGSVTTNLTLSGGTSGQSKLNVNYGAWTAKDIAVNSGDIVIGASSDADGTALADPSLYKASLSANKLTLGANASTTVKTNGSATLNELDMSAGTLNVSGTMTVNGHFVAANDKVTPNTPASYGVAITGGDIKVSGRNANLIFGEDAVKAITLNAGTADTPASVNQH